MNSNLLLHITGEYGTELLNQEISKILKTNYITWDGYFGKDSYHGKVIIEMFHRFTTEEKDQLRDLFKVPLIFKENNGLITIEFTYMLEHDLK